MASFRPQMVYGNKPTDGGNLILKPEEKDAMACLKVKIDYVSHFCLEVRIYAVKGGSGGRLARKERK